MENYRPISLLRVVSKVLERVALKQIQDYMECENLFSSGQHGFRRDHSTFTALTWIHNNLTSQQNGGCSGLLQFDLSAAFACIDHDVLVNKLEVLGFGQTARKWTMTFLRRRVQHVACNDEISEATILEVGSPQGSVLSPLVFLLYTIDFQMWLPENLRRGYTGFADDTVVVVGGKDSLQLKENLEKVAAITLDFMSKNKLKANESKTKFMICRGNRTRKKDPVIIKVGHSTINESETTNILGVTLQPDLKRHTHLRYLRTEMNMCLGTIKLLLSRIP